MNFEKVIDVPAFIMVHPIRTSRARLGLPHDKSLLVVKNVRYIKDKVDS